MCAENPELYGQKDIEKPPKIERVIAGDITILYSLVQGKRWSDFSPKQELGDVMQRLIIEARQIGTAHTLGQVEFNRVESGSFGGGQWLVAQICYTPNHDRSASLSPSTQLKDLQSTADTVSARFVIQDSIINNMLAKFDTLTLQPLAEFTAYAMQQLGANININAMLLQGLEVWCMASKRV